MGNITFTGISKSSLTINSCLFFERQSPFTGVPFVFWSFRGKLDVQDWKITGLFWCIPPLLLQKGPAHTLSPISQASFQINHVVFA